MVRVSKTDVKKGTSIELNVTEKCWERIKTVPTVFGANLKWERVREVSHAFDPGAKHKAHDDLAEPEKVQYTEEAYKYDCEQGKKLFETGEYQKSLEFLERALIFQPRNQYIRKLVKQITDGKGTAD